MKTIYVIFLISLLLFSCQKDKPKPIYTGPTTAVGKVTDATNGKSVAFATAILTRNKSGSSSRMGRETVDTQYTGEDGNFSFSFTAEEGYNYRVEAEAEHYYISGGDGAAFLRENAVNNNLSVKIKPKGYIKFIIINEEPTEPRQLAVFGEFNIIYIQPDETSRIVTTLGNKEVGIVIRVTQSGIYSYKYDSVYVNSLDTTEFIIKY